jgi:peptidoglycan hydrolase CwlO-like protein
MTDKELIVVQAKELVEKNEEVVRLQKKIRQIRTELTSVGAPLNDNILGYTDKQLKPFADIEDIING